MTQAQSRVEAISLRSDTYFTGKPCKRGHLSERRISNSACIKRINIATTKRWRENYGRYVESKKRLRRLDRIANLLHAARQRARKRGLEFSITRADLVASDNCPCCGRKFIPANDNGWDKSACHSIDRLDNRRGYVPGNVAIICLRCNQLKNNATVADLLTIVAWMQRSSQSKSYFPVPA